MPDDPIYVSWKFLVPSPTPRKCCTESSLWQSGVLVQIDPILVERIRPIRVSGQAQSDSDGHGPAAPLKLRAFAGVVGLNESSTLARLAPAVGSAWRWSSGVTSGLDFWGFALEVDGGPAAGGPNVGEGLGTGGLVGMAWEVGAEQG